MKRLSGREKAIVGVAAAAVVVFVYLFALLLPARRAVANSAQQQADLRDQLEQATRMYREASTAERKIADLNKRVSEIMFPAADVQSATVSTIQSLSKELGITVTSIRPEDPEISKEFTRYPTAVKVEAEIGKIARMLYELEQPNRRLWVEGVEITSAKQTGSTLQATIYVAAYRPPRESEAPDAEA